MTHTKIWESDALATLGDGKVSPYLETMMLRMEEMEVGRRCQLRLAAGIWLLLSVPPLTEISDEIVSAAKFA